MAAYNARIRPRWYIFKQNSLIIEYWEYLIIMFAIYNGIVTPWSVSFDYVQYLQRETILGTFDLLVNIFFAIDIIVGFMTSFIEPTSGDEIYSPKRICHHYIFEGDFLVDFISTCPVLSILMIFGVEETPLLIGITDMFSLLKVTRVRKILQKISHLNRTVEEKSMYQIIFWVFFIFLYTHIIACLMWYNFRHDAKWIPAVDFGAVSSRLHMPYSNYEEREYSDYDKFLYQFFTMWYNSALSMAIVEVNPRTENQLRVQFIIYVMNAIINATIFGIFIELITILNSDEARK